MLLPFLMQKNIDHKYTVGIMQVPLSDTQNLDHKHSVGMTQFGGMIIICTITLSTVYRTV